MLTDWTFWISSLHAAEFVLILAPILLLDAPRYALGSFAVWCCDWPKLVWDRIRGRGDAARFEFTPDVCVIIAGLNEAPSLSRALESVLDSYPRLQTIVVDDGSSDGMTAIANQYARRRDDVSVIRNSHRGGKSSAMNAALPFTSAEVIIVVDGDSHLGEHAIWEAVQPFQNPRVGAVSGAVLVRDPYRSLIHWLQSLEYLRCIFVGRMFTHRMGILGIVSGAFGAFRRDLVVQLGGWDVGPAEDGDLTLRVRRAGYEIAYAPYAMCYTAPAADWRQLTKQRRRWEWAVVTLELRKHRRMANPFSGGFRFSNLVLLLDRWLYSIVFQYAFLAYLIWSSYHFHDRTVSQYLLYYAVYLAFECLHVMLLMYYWPDRKMIATHALILPLMPLYYVYLRAITLWAVTEEWFTRRSYEDDFVPSHVRRVAFRW